MVTLNRNQILVQTLSNYLESGVITPDEVDKTADTIMQYSDNEMVTNLTESHIARELLYAIRNFRMPN